MTDTPTITEPEPPEQPRPFQFSIRSLMIFTAAVAGFFALATQAPVIFTVCYVLLASALGIFPKYWRGIFASNFFLFYWILLITFSIYQFPDGERLSIASLLVSLASAIYAIFSTHPFDKIAGVLCVIASSFLGLMFLLFLITR